MPAVSVVVKGAGIGKITDSEGRFSIEAPYSDATLVFSFIGFQPQEIPLQGKSELNVTLEEDVTALSDVVVVGYSRQRKETLLGSLASMTTKDLVQSPTANINNALAGRLPGLMVNQLAGGEPGVDRADLYVRGIGTYGNKSPIVIVDGVEREMSYLSGDEIETFTILKDASATAQYGVRGANGVIVISTKRGKAQEKATVTFKSAVGVNQPVKFPSYLGSADYATLYNEALLNDYRGDDPSSLPLFSAQAIENFRSAKGDNSDGLGYDWNYFDYAFQPGIQQDYGLSVRGGNDKARYYVSAGYYNQGGNYTHTELDKYSTQAVFKRYNFRSNIDIDVTDKLYVKLDLGARITDRTAPGTTAARVVQLANTQPPYLPITLQPNDNPDNAQYLQNNPDGLLFGDQTYRFNILGELSKTGYLNEKKTYFNGDFALGYDLDAITQGLKVEGSFSYDAQEGRWINRRVNTYFEGYREYPSYATFRPTVGSDVFKNNPTSVRGGNDKARYYVSAGYYNQGGNYTHTELDKYSTQAVFKRYNFRSNIDIDVTDKLYVKLDLGARITDRTAPGTTAARVVQLANTQPPYLPITLQPNDNPDNAQYLQNNPDGLLFGDQTYRFNILGELSKTGYLNEKKTYFNGDFALGYDLDAITQGLKVEGSFSYDAQEGRWINRRVNTYFEGYREYPSYATFRPTVGSDVFKNNPTYGEAYQTGNRYDVDQTIGNDFTQNDAESKVYYQLKLDYKRTFGYAHEVSGLLLFNRSIRNHNQDVDYRYQGLTGRATYYYDSRYLVEFNFGYNGSENFAKGHRYGFFPALSAGWVITNESFMQPAKWLNTLKVRASRGLVGSDNIPSGRWHYLQFFEGGDGYSFGQNFGNGTNGRREAALANPTLSWETARKTNVGLDVTILSNRLDLTVDAFYEYRYDIFTELGGSDKIGFPAVVGKDAPLINSGTVENKGVDFEVGWSDRIGKDFKYYARVNFAFARNKILFQNEISYESYNSQAYRASTGRRIGENFVYLFDHFVKDQAEADALNESGYQSLWGTMRPGDAVYKDLNNDGEVSDAGDRTYAGNPRTPEIHFGVPLGFQYRGLDFSVLFQGAASASVMLQGAAVWDFPSFDSDKTGKVKAMHLNRWTPETAETATYPALSLLHRTVNHNPSSSLFLYDAKYVRLKNLELGYTLPSKWVGKAGLQQVRIYAQGLNLLTWDGLDEVDIDPETNSGSGDWYPVQKVYNFGIDITF